MKVQDIICGSLLGDGSLRSQNNKYFSLKITAKDKRFTSWLEKSFNNFGLKCWTTEERENIFSVWFYINTCPYPEFLKLRQKWYREEDIRAQKVVPKDLELTPSTLFYWYLGDGSLIRRKNDTNRVPPIVLATNCFQKEDIDFLIQKLKGLNLNFYPVKYKSGFTGEECGSCLYSSTEDGTPFRFFKLIGFECPKEIKNCSTGSKGIYKEEKFFRDKWPNEEDWIKILSNVKGIGPFLREKRLQLGLSQNQFGKKISIRRENIRDVELSKRNFSVKRLRLVLKALNLDITYLLEKLSNEKFGTGS